jgi:hypothetical protein
VGMNVTSADGGITKSCRLVLAAMERRKRNVVERLPL